MKARNNLLQLRNEYLIKRYYYWYELERLRMDDVLKILSTKEVFLEEDYILRIVRENGHLLKEIRAAKLSNKTVMRFDFPKKEKYVTGDLFAQLSTN